MAVGQTIGDEYICEDGVELVTETTVNNVDILNKRLSLVASVLLLFRSYTLNDKRSSKG